MRRFDYYDFMKEKKEKFFSVKAMLGKKRLPGRRKRDPEERDLLMIMDRNRFQRWLQEGKLKMLSIRHFIMEL